MGMATAQEINPPVTTNIPIFLPTIYPTEIRAGDKLVPIPKMEPPTRVAPSNTACHMENPCSAIFMAPPARPAIAMVFNPLFDSAESDCLASSPARRTSAVAIPSGYCN